MTPAAVFKVFHACFEVYVSWKWASFDPSRLAPLNGLIRMGVGRDASEVSVATIYGNVGFKNLWVSNKSADDFFNGIFMNDVEDFGIYFKS